ncbi:hypothetical protein Ae201684P_021793 [Aphanomyces euteiches]|nr:hypothetical protein Ae201684P_021793 [Aphanomyces euteiches]
MISLQQEVLLDSTVVKPTGIPPHVSLYACIGESQNAIEAFPDIIVDRNITHTLLKSTIADIIRKTTNLSARDEVSPASSAPIGMFVWGERFRRLPIDFVFPSVGPTTAYELWWREWKLIMRHFEQICAESGLFLTKTPSDDELLASSRVISAYLQTICASKSNSRQRRVSQLKLMSIVRDVRAAIKKRKVDE